MNKINLGIILIFLYIMSSCTPYPRYLSFEGDGVVSVYKLSDFKDYPVLKTEYGIASYYGKKYHGKRTSSGKLFNMYKLSAAHRIYPLGTIVRVTNLKNDRQVIVEINDRGPFVKGRVIDLSYGAAVKLGFIRSGTTEVKIEVLKWGSKK
ncbi:hypothetical protein DRQ09_05080 [candidate division KSB1 bacterium]|nr:MAG: hypothetical protein DRQ09_05080 [candidate division KSB1 bacterium]